MATGYWPQTYFYWPQTYFHWPQGYPYWTEFGEYEPPTATPLVVFVDPQGERYVLHLEPIEGQLPAAEGVLYTGAAGALSYVRELSLNNTHAANTNVVQLYVRRVGSSSREVLYASLAPHESIFLSDLKVLNPGDTLRAKATNADEVDYDGVAEERASL